MLKQNAVDKKNLSTAFLVLIYSTENYGNPSNKQIKIAQNNHLNLNYDDFLLFAFEISLKTTQYVTKNLSKYYSKIYSKPQTD